MHFFMYALCAALLATTTAMATEAPNVEMGQTLFRSTELGTNGKSCASCHPSGKGLGNLYGWETPLLKEQVNDCIRGALQGEPLDGSSTEMNSLIVYLKSL